MKKIYTKSFKCSQCRKVIAEYSEKNRTRTVKSWTSVCLKCFNIDERKTLDGVLDALWSVMNCSQSNDEIVEVMDILERFVGKVKIQNREQSLRQVKKLLNQ